MLYWTGGDWWGIGPGAHSHVGGVRWWNVRHPSAYAARLAEDHSPAHAREVLTTDDQHLEEIMLGIRLSDGLPVRALTATALDDAKRRMVPALVDPSALSSGRLVLTRQGRLLADAITRDLT
jgi:coproporphyrinogen III oxidase-like Fe-S oxidoreductase